MFKKIGIKIIIFAIAVLPFYSVFALKNPSAVYCKQMGYEWAVKETEAGQMGICKFSETENCPAWDFLTGKCGADFSYCVKEGYEIKAVDGYAVCILKNGKEVEVTELMDLNFEEGVCGDSKCVLGENYEICPQDCPSGFFDNYCDGIKDDLCDPNCTFETDPDCAGKSVYIDVAVCADKNCFQKDKFFAQGEIIYFKINSDRTNLDISSTIKNPDGEIKHLVFENNLATFQSDEVGIFSLWVNFSEKGQLKSRAEKHFFYTQNKTSLVSICNADGKCDGEENEINCPKDCLSKTTWINNNLYIFVAIILIIVTGIIIFILKRKRKN